MNRIKDFRTQKGLSQLALAKAIGVARQTINLIENDKYNPSLDLCIKLAEALDTDLNSLFWHHTMPKEETTMTLREQCLPILSTLYLNVHKASQENPQYKEASQAINRFLEDAKDKALEGVAFATRFETFIKAFSLVLLAEHLTLPDAAKPAWDELYQLFQSKEMVSTLRAFRLIL